MKEITRRAMSTASEGMACGPEEIYAVNAEIVVEDNGTTVYLHTQWVDEADDTVLFEATTESVYDAELEIAKTDADDDDAFMAAVDKRDEIQSGKDISTVLGDIDINERYAGQYEQLLQMMQDVLDRDEIGFDIHELEYTDEGDLD